MKKFFSLVLALVMALSLTTVAWAADVTVTNSTELQAAVNDSANAGKTIKLTASATSYKVELTSASADNLTIEGVDGAVMSYLEAAVGYEGTFTVKNCTFDVPATTWCYACLQGKYNVTFDTCTFKAGNMDSAIYVENGYDDAVFTLKNCTFYGTYVETPVVLSNSASHAFAVTATGNTFVGNDGGLGIYAKDSTMTLNTDEENVTHLAKTEAAIHAAVAVANAGDTIKLRNDGTNSPMTLANDLVLNKPITIDANDVTLANFPEGENITTNADGEITGGTFSDPAAAEPYLADGVILSATGSVVALPTSVIPSGGATLAPSFPVRGEAQYASWDAKVVAKKAENAKDSEFATYTIEMYAKVDNAPIWWDSGVADDKGDDVDFVWDNEKTFVKVSEELADFVIVDGKTVTYFAVADDINDDGWDAKVSAVNLPLAPNAMADAKCNTYYITDVDDLATPFFWYEGDLYAPAVTYTHVFNVAGVAVGAAEVVPFDTYFSASTAADRVVYLNHNYIVEYKGNGYGAENVSKVFCDVCKKSFDFAVGSELAAVAKFGEGKYFVLDTGLFVEKDTTPNTVRPSAGTSSGTTTTDKTVTSADTFDAGIAMYGGMSVMAAAGSAVVLKKRED